MPRNAAIYPNALLVGLPVKSGYDHHNYFICTDNRIDKGGKSLYVIKISLYKNTVSFTIQKYYEINFIIH